MTFRMGENHTEIDLVLIKKTLAVLTKCKGNPWEVSTYIGDSRYR